MVVPNSAYWGALASLSLAPMAYVIPGLQTGEGSMFWYRVYTWALKGLLYDDFGAYVYAKVVLGPFELGGGSMFW